MIVIPKKGKLDFIISASWIPIILFLLAQIGFNQGQGITTEYVKVYITLGIIGLAYAVSNLILEFIPKFKKSTIAGYGFLAETDNERVLSVWKYGRFAPHIIFTILVVLMGLAGQQVFPDPLTSPFAEETVLLGEISPMKNAWFNSVPVGIFEDINALIISVVVMLLLYPIQLFIFKVRKSKLWFTIRAFFASGVSATIFMFAHTNAYQSNTGAYVVAFFFQMIQQFIYLITGLFLPLAHIANNYMFSLQFFAGGFAIFSLTKFIVVPIYKKHKEVK